jgi:hypothetical protein
LCFMVPSRDTLLIMIYFEVAGSAAITASSSDGNDEER